MNKIHFQNNTPQNPHLLPVVSFLIFAATLLLASRALANNAVLRSMFSCQAQGLGGATPEIKVWFQQGTNLSFIPAGEKIKKAWIDDPSNVTLDFDGPLCQQFGQQQNSNPTDCDKSEANVIHLRRIPKLDIPGLPNTDSTLLSVVTEGKGTRTLYTFEVKYGNGPPEYRTLAIYADPSSNSQTPCVRKKPVDG